MPRVKLKLSGSPAGFPLIERRSQRNSLGRLERKAPAHNTRMLTLALHAEAALHRGYAMSLNCVTGMKANEIGRLVNGVTPVTPVTPVLEGGWICALMLPFQIGPTPHCWHLGWVIALHLTTHLHCTCPLICIRLGQSFASDLTSTLDGPDWQKSTQSCPS